MRRLIVIAVALLVLVAVGFVAFRHQPKPTPGTVAVAGFTLTSASVTLPQDDPLFPDGPHADVVNANCTSCHSASMALTQPRLKPEQWEAEVKKMREVYKAPVAEADVPGILAYLNAMPGQGAAR